MHFEKSPSETKVAIVTPSKITSTRRTDELDAERLSSAMATMASLRSADVGRYGRYTYWASLFEPR